MLNDDASRTIDDAHGFAVSLPLTVSGIVSSAKDMIKPVYSRITRHLSNPAPVFPTGQLHLEFSKVRHPSRYHYLSTMQLHPWRTRTQELPRSVQGAISSNQLLVDFGYHRLIEVPVHWVPRRVREVLLGGLVSNDNSKFEPAE